MPCFFKASPIYSLYLQVSTVSQRVGDEQGSVNFIRGIGIQDESGKDNEAKEMTMGTPYSCVGFENHDTISLATKIRV